MDTDTGGGSVQTARSLTGTAQEFAVSKGDKIAAPAAGWIGHRPPNLPRLPVLRATTSAHEVASASRKELQATAPINTPAMSWPLELMAAATTSATTIKPHSGSTIVTSKAAAIAR